MMKTRMYHLLGALCGALAFPLVAAEEYLVGVGNYEYLPHHGIVNDQYKGYARDVLDLFSHTSGYRLSYRALPWKRVMLEYINGKIDCIFPDNPYWDTEEKTGLEVHYSQAMVNYIDGVFVLPEKKGKGLRHLKKLGTIRGFTAWDYVDNIKSGEIKLHENNQFVPLLQQVLLNRIDGAYIEVSVAKYYLREHLKQPDALVFDAALPHTKDNYYLSSINAPQIIQAFNKFLISEHEAIKRLQKHYKVGAFAQ